MPKRRVESDKRESLLRPSDFVRAKNWLRVQFREPPKFLCYRGPPEAAPKVPLLLIEPSFVRFVECYNNRNVAPSADDMASASKLCNLLASGLCSEEDLLSIETEGRDVKWELERAYKSSINRVLSMYIDARVFGVSARGDGDVEFGNLSGFFARYPGVITVVTEWRSDEDPCFELLTSLKCFFQEMVPCEKTSHVLGLCFMGAFVQALGVVWDWQQGKLLAEPLTDYICCSGPSASRFEHVSRLLRAVKLFFECYTRSEAGINVRIPWHVRYWEAEPLDDMVFLCKQHPRGGVVVKFCEFYNGDAHKAWEKQGVAPEFYEQQFIPCGWRMVIMEYLDPKQGWENAADYARKNSKDKACLERLQAAVGDALTSGHGSGFCHGDFRLENLMVKQADDAVCVKAVDFEFAGETSKGTYPRILGDAITWAQGAACGATLEEHHDRHFVERIVADYGT